MQPIKPGAAILLAWIITGSGCATQSTLTALPLPTRPILPAISQAEFAPLPNAPDHYIVHRDTLVKLFQRDAMRKAYAEELEAVIGAAR